MLLAGLSSFTANAQSDFVVLGCWKEIAYNIVLCDDAGNDKGVINIDSNGNFFMDKFNPENCKKYPKFRFTRFGSENECFRYNEPETVHCIKGNEKFGFRVGYSNNKLVKMSDAYYQKAVVPVKNAAGFYESQGGDKSKFIQFAIPKDEKPHDYLIMKQRIYGCNKIKLILVDTGSNIIVDKYLKKQI
jgi:hypothetical protein